MIPGAMLKFDLREGFPAVTTKKLFYGACKGELLGFLRGYTNSSDFEKLGCKFWHQNANENQAWLSNRYRLGKDDLGYIYSRLWTDMPNGGNLLSSLTPWNQISKLIHAIKTDPTSRRLLVSAWHPEVFDQAALPPCHYAFQVIIEQETKTMHMLWNQRSCDLFLGVPMNIASYATLCHILAAVTGYTPGTLTGFLADVHIYENHLDQVKEQLTREPRSLPTLQLADKVNPTIIGKGPVYGLTQIEPDDLTLVGYSPWEAIRAPMAV